MQSRRLNNRFVLFSVLCNALFLASACSHGLPAQGSSRTVGTGQSTNDHPHFSIVAVDTLIRRLEQVGVKGILTGDTVLLSTIWDSSFMVTTPRNSVAPDRTAVFRNQQAGLIDYSSFERVVEHLHLQQDVVITMGYEVFTARHDLPEAKAGIPVKRRFTNVWLWKQGAWKQIGRHASVICN